MKKYNDKELNRLLSESDELLADLNLNLYETPEEEQARKKKEEEKRQEEQRRLKEEEQRRLEEQQRQEVRQKHRLEEQRKQEEQHQLEEQKKQEKQHQLEEQKKQDEERTILKQQEAELRRIQEAERKKQRKLHREEIEQALYEAVVTKEEDSFEAVEVKEEDSFEAVEVKEEDSFKAVEAKEDNSFEAAVTRKEKHIEDSNVIKEQLKTLSRQEIVPESEEKLGTKDKSAWDVRVHSKTKAEEIQKEVSLPKDNETIEPKPQLDSPSESKQEANKNYSQAASVLYMMVSFMFMEAMTHLGAYGTLGTNFIYPLFFAASLGGVICLLSSFLNVKGNTIVAFLLQILFAAYCDLQMIYYAAMGSFLRLSQARDDMWLLVHSEQMKEAATESLPWLVLMFLPIILWAVIGRRFIQFQQSHWLTKLVFLIGTVVFAVIGIIMLDLKGYEDYSPYAAFYNYESGIRTEQTGNQLGMTALTGLEILELFR